MSNGMGNDISGFESSNSRHSEQLGIPRADTDQRQLNRSTLGRGGQRQ